MSLRRSSGPPDGGKSPAEAGGEVPVEEFNAKSQPVHWPTLIVAETEDEWQQLRDWVEQLYVRFPHVVRVPPCWWQHNDLVELLSALRDYERASYATNALPTAAVDWHRAFKEIEGRMDMWIKRFDCSLSGREHAMPVSNDGWKAFIAADAQARRTEHRSMPAAGDR